MPPVVKNKKFDSNIESINTYIMYNTCISTSINDTGDKFEWENDSSTDISDYNSGTLSFPLEIICITLVYKKGKFYSNKLMWITVKVLTNLSWCIMQFIFSFLYLAKGHRNSNNNSNNFRYTIFTLSFNRFWHPVSHDDIRIDPRFLVKSWSESNYLSNDTKMFVF